MIGFVLATVNAIIALAIRKYPVVHTLSPATWTLATREPHILKWPPQLEWAGAPFHITSHSRWAWSDSPGTKTLHFSKNLPTIIVNTSWPPPNSFPIMIWFTHRPPRLHSFSLGMCLKVCKCLQTHQSFPQTKLQLLLYLNYRMPCNQASPLLTEAGCSLRSGDRTRTNEVGYIDVNVSMWRADPGSLTAIHGRNCHTVWVWVLADLVPIAKCLTTAPTSFQQQCVH